jgi:CBS domain-containing protein
MRCEELMKTGVIYVREDDNVQAAARLMRDANVGFVPVVDPGQRAVGTLTDRDLAVRVCADDLVASRCAVRDFMSRELVSCRPEDDLETASGLMARYQKSRILVTGTDNVLRGVISLSDLALAEGAGAELRGESRAARTLRDIARREARPS